MAKKKRVHKTVDAILDEAEALAAAAIDAQPGKPPIKSAPGTKAPKRLPLEESRLELLNWVRELVVLVNGRECAIDLIDEASYDAADIDAAFRNQTDRAAFWVGMQNALEANAKRAKLIRDRARARVARMCRAGEIELPVGRSGTPTEAAIKEAVELHEAVQKAEDILVVAEEQAGVAKGMVLSVLKDRREMILADAWSQRAEYASTGMTVKDGRPRKERKFLGSGVIADEIKRDLG